MTYQHKLQIPISDELNQKLKGKAKELGFSSISEVTRFLLTNLVNGNLNIVFVNQTNGINTKLDETIAEALWEHTLGKTQKLDLSKSLHEQIIENP